MRAPWKLIALLLMPLLGGVLAVASLEVIFTDTIARNEREGLLGSGARFVASELARLPPEDREPRLEELKGWFQAPLELVEACGDGVSLETVATGPGPKYVASVALDDVHCLRAGPLIPPRSPRVLIFVVAVSSTMIAFVLAAIVALRQRRQIGVLGEAARELSQGEFDTRVSAGRLGSLAVVGERFNEMAGALQADFQRRQALLAAIAHEIGTPLARIRLELALLREARNDEERAVHLEGIDGDVEAVECLGREIAAWLQADAKGTDGPGFMLASALDGAHELVDEPVQLELAIPQISLRGDLRSAERVFDNLIDNAARYARGRIVVEAERAGAFARIEVRDDGPGIPSFERSRVQEPFVRLDETRSRSTGGMGLGLAIVHRIVHSYGGTLELGDAAEGGLRCVVEWPLEVEPDA